MNKQLLRAYARKLAVACGHQVSTSEAEAEIVRTIDVVVTNLSANPKMVYGYHAREDIEQTGRLFALEVLGASPPTYDIERPLENFLFTHVRNRLINLKRDTFMRAEPPCSCCDPYGSPAEPCRKWKDWHKRNAAKQGLMRPLGMAVAPEASECATAEEEVSLRETLDLIDEHLPLDLRGDYLRMRDGAAVPKARRLKVRAAILSILEGAPLAP